MCRSDVRGQIRGMVANAPIVPDIGSQTYWFASKREPNLVKHWFVDADSADLPGDLVWRFHPDPKGSFCNTPVATDQGLAFTVDDFQDLLRLLEHRPEWRAELRR